jgi:hypothetical protein
VCGTLLAPPRDVVAQSHHNQRSTQVLPLRNASARFLGGNQWTFAEGHFRFQVVAVMAGLWYSKSPLRVMFDKDLSEGARLLYAALVWWKRDDDQQPTQAQMADELGISERKVRRGMAELVASGLVTHHRRGRGKNRGGYSSYIELPYWDRPPVDAPKRWSSPPVDAPGERPRADAPKASTTQREGKADGENARAVESAGSEDEARIWLLVRGYLKDNGGVYKHQSDVLIHPQAPDILEKALEKGFVSADDQKNGKYFALTTQEAPHAAL